MSYQCRVQRLQQALVARDGYVAVEPEQCPDQAGYTVVFNFDEPGFSETYEVALCEHHYNVATLQGGYTKHFKLRPAAAA